MLFCSCLPEWCHPPFRLCLHKVVESAQHPLSPWLQHCISTTPPPPPPPPYLKSTRLPCREAIGRRVGLAGARSNGRRGQWCHRWQRCVSEGRASVGELLLTHQLNKGGCHISSNVFEGNRWRRTDVRVGDVTQLSAAVGRPLILLISPDNQRVSPWELKGGGECMGVVWKVVQNITNRLEQPNIEAFSCKQMWPDLVSE